MCFIWIILATVSVESAMSYMADEVYVKADADIAVELERCAIFRLEV